MYIGKVGEDRRFMCPLYKYGKQARRLRPRSWAKKFSFLQIPWTTLEAGGKASARNGGVSSIRFCFSLAYRRRIG